MLTLRQHSTLGLATEASRKTGFFYGSMYYVYILYSEKKSQFYKGQTNDLADRLVRHNSGFEKATQDGLPWVLFWRTVKSTRSEAVVLERKLKNLSQKDTIPLSV